eukprot:TRINITY_DN7427_c0_g1_i21.p3 TRINITY_DN7427_c0_g1~~TRINITY_DN7427_c0_g1_i21.p3  ORF type:complete len:150 (-),score=8.98 TRINITY_DN7427_c0_g1_i21:541-990(-)
MCIRDRLKVDLTFGMENTPTTQIPAITQTQGSYTPTSNIPQRRKTINTSEAGSKRNKRDISGAEITKGSGRWTREENERFAEGKVTVAHSAATLREALEEGGVPRWHQNGNSGQKPRAEVFPQDLPLQVVFSCRTQENWQCSGVCRRKE